MTMCQAALLSLQANAFVVTIRFDCARSIHVTIGEWDWIEEGWRDRRKWKSLERGTRDEVGKSEGGDVPRSPGAGLPLSFRDGQAFVSPVAPVMNYDGLSAA